LPLGDISPLQNSAFGLWFRHKAPLLFDENRELPLVEECVTRVDDSLLPLIRLRAVSDSQSHDLQNVVNNILTETEQIKFLINSMFERLTDMEVGRDPLTQLFNRRFLPTIMKKEVELSRRKGSSFALLMIDVDFFKKVNDTHGHESGDRVLQQVAALAINKTRAGDFIFRYGGEEFLLLLTEVDVNQAQEVADKIRQTIETADILLSGGKTLRVTVSIGVALSDGNPDYQRVIERADKALYTAKNSGRNRCVLAD
jgi:diguanylate cyclase